MDQSQLNWIRDFIWNIADDYLRDVYVRGKYRDVILPMTVIRRLDAVLEPTKQAVLDMDRLLDEAGITEKSQALCKAAGQSFYNTSPFRLRNLKSVAHNQTLQANFNAYLNGFSPNVREIIDKFKFRNQIPTMVEANILGYVIEKFLDPAINLSPFPVKDENGDEDGEESNGPKKKAIPEKRRKKLLDPETWERDHRLHAAAKSLWEAVGDEVFMDHNVFRERFEAAAKDMAPALSPAERKLIQRAVSERDESAAPVLSGKPSKPKKELDYAPERLYGQFLVTNDERSEVVEYEPDPELRDTEQVPLLEKGGIEGFFRREVLPYAEDAWIDPKGTKVGYEISFARYFHKPAPLRTLEQIRADILALERDTEGLLQRILEDSP